MRLKLALVVVVGQPRPPNTWACDRARTEAAITRNIMAKARMVKNGYIPIPKMGIYSNYPGDSKGKEVQNFHKISDKNTPLFFF